MKTPFMNLVFTMYSIYYFWNLIGIEIYGGLITPQMFDEVTKLNPDTEIGHSYMWLNFNDFISGLLTLFSMMLGNNWQFIWGQFNFAIDGDDLTTDLFFFTFIMLTQYVLINIIMAFVIDVYTSIEESVKKERTEKEAVELLGLAEIQWQGKLAEQEPKKKNAFLRQVSNVLTRKKSDGGEK